MSNSIAMITGEQETPAEARLWRTVIARTIEEWVSGPLRRQREAEQYLFDDRSDFRLVCQAAGMDADFLRKKLTKLRRQPAVNGAKSGGQSAALNTSLNTSLNSSLSTDCRVAA